MSDKLSREFSQFRGLLLNLPHGDVGYYGTLLRHFCLNCQNALNDGADPIDVVEKFLNSLQQAEPDICLNIPAMLARFVQFIEREVALLDAVEESDVIEQYDADHNPALDSLTSWVARERLQNSLGIAVRDFSLRIVLTAHPTEFYPTVIQRLIRELSQAMAAKDGDKIELLILQLSKTSFRYRQRVSPEDEADRLIGYLREVFFKAIPVIQRQLRQHLAASEVDMDHVRPSQEPMVVMGFWPGGDRDGNPAITCAVTMNVLQTLRRSVLACYIQAFERLNERLTFVGLESAQTRITQRLQATLNSNLDQPTPPESYLNPSEFLADLEALQSEIIQQHQGVFVDLFRPLFDSVRCFGFHFAALDIRQDSHSHYLLLNLILRHLNEPEWEDATSASDDKLATLNRLVERRDQIDREDLLAAIKQGDSSDQQPLYQTALLMTRIDSVHRFNGEASLNRYIISQTTSKLDCLILLTLLRLFTDRAADKMDIVPLFESISDLKSATTIMEALYEDPVYAEYLNTRGKQVTVMLGFSDGTKDGGYLAGSGNIRLVKQQLSASSEKYGIRIVFFDGRGGPPGRGGGSVTDYYASMGPMVHSRQIQLTIQGQTISSSFASTPSAVGTIASFVATGLENRILKSTGRLQQLSVSNRDLLDEMIDDSYHYYRKLVEHPQFTSFLTEVTPFPYFALANHSSRPSKRKGVVSLNSIRAIPYVASWSQIKMCISGYYGFGYALDAAIESYGLDRLKKLYQESRFFKALVLDSQTVLARSDVRFTRHLEQDQRYKAVHVMVREETERSREVFNKIRNSRINPSLNIREEIQLPAVWLQQYCMRKLADLKQDDSSDDQTKYYQDMIVRLMAIIINAARNSA